MLSGAVIFTHYFLNLDQQLIVLLYILSVTSAGIRGKFAVNQLRELCFLEEMVLQVFPLLK